MHGDKISPCIGSTISKKFFVFIWDGLERVREALPEGDPPLQNISKIIQFLFWESLSNLINQSKTNFLTIVNCLLKKGKQHPSITQQEVLSENGLDG